MYLLSYSKSGVQNFRRFNLSANDNLRYIKGIDGHVRLVPLQTDNCRLYLCQQTDKEQTFICTWANGKRIKEYRLGFRFPCLMSPCLHVSMSMSPCRKRKRKSVFRSRQTVNDDCCFSKRAHLWIKGIKRHIKETIQRKLRWVKSSTNR
jgi:hypothetical protein